ncbi:MAG TPA: biotin--[acetyl-CoA-carboxylase] ligase [Acidimicrobiales bacterium]|nr:biotin--[acetyl-CoA-carboxylase] ligase [Acidimicrobiales bacterium]
MCAAAGVGETAGAFATVPGPPGTRFGDVRRFAEIDSTNRYLLDLARQGAPEGTVVVADHQSAGRGRLGRRWEAPPGANLLVSVLLRPDVPLEELHLCTVAVALAAADACAGVSGLVPELKWPNDLMAGERKLAGVLAESLPGAPGDGGRPRAERARAVVVGVGVNVRWPPPDPPTAGADDAELLRTATSIWRETGTVVDPLALLDAVLVELEPHVAALAGRDGRRRLATTYRRRCATVGQTVRVSTADDELTGTAMDITPEGHLVLDVGACFKTIAAGDVVHLRRPV